MNNQTPPQPVNCQPLSQRPLRISPFGVESMWRACHPTVCRDPTCRIVHFAFNSQIQYSVQLKAVFLCSVFQKPKKHWQEVAFDNLLKSYTESSLIVIFTFYLIIKMYGYHYLEISGVTSGFTCSENSILYTRILSISYFLSEAALTVSCNWIIPQLTWLYFTLHSSLT